jgi:hypothetical protein
MGGISLLSALGTGINSIPEVIQMEMMGIKLKSIANVYNHKGHNYFVAFAVSGVNNVSSFLTVPSKSRSRMSM